MNSDFDVRDRELEQSIIFRASFNWFEPINLSQARSLMLSAGRDDGLLGLRAAVGWFVTLSVLASIILIAIEKLDFGTL